MSWQYGDDEYDEDDFEEWSGDPDSWSYHMFLCKDRKGNVYVYELILGGYSGGQLGSFGYPDIPISENTFGLKRCRNPLRSRLQKLVVTLAPGEIMDVTALARYYARYVVSVFKHSQHRGIYRSALTARLLLACVERSEELV